MKLLAIRNFNEQDPLPPLGPKHEPAKPVDSAPAPAPVPGRPGIVRHPDGKLSTDLPEPPKAAVHDSTAKVGPPYFKDVDFAEAELRVAASNASSAGTYAFAVGSIVRVKSGSAPLRYGSGIAECETLRGCLVEVAASESFVPAEPAVRVRPMGSDKGGWWFHPSELEPSSLQITGSASAAALNLEERLRQAPPSWFEAIQLGQELEITNSRLRVCVLKKHADGKRILVRRVDGMGSAAWVDCDLLG